MYYSNHFSQSIFNNAFKQLQCSVDDFNQAGEENVPDVKGDLVII